MGMVVWQKLYRRILHHRVPSVWAFIEGFIGCYWIDRFSLLRRQSICLGKCKFIIILRKHVTSVFGFTFISFEQLFLITCHGIKACTHSSSIRASKNIKEARWSWSWSLQRFWPFLKLRMLVSILVMGWQQPPALLLALHVDCARQGVVSRFLDGLNRKIPKLLTDFSLTFLVPLVDRKTKKKKKKKTQTWIQVRELLLKLAWTPSST